MHTRFKQYSENLWLTHDPWKYSEYLCIFPSKIGIIYALKWKLGTCITFQQDCQDMAYTEKLLGIKKKTHFK